MSFSKWKYLVIFNLLDLNLGSSWLIWYSEFLKPCVAHVLHISLNCPLLASELWKTWFRRQLLQSHILNLFAKTVTFSSHWQCGQQWEARNILQAILFFICLSVCDQWQFPEAERHIRGCCNSMLPVSHVLEIRALKSTVKRTSYLFLVFYLSRIILCLGKPEKYMKMFKF